VLDTVSGSYEKTVNTLLTDKDEIPWLYRTRGPEVYSQETPQQISTPILSEGGYRSQHEAGVASSFFSLVFGV